MIWRFLIYGFSFLFMAWLSPCARAQFKDFHGAVDANWSGPTFKLSQAYPSELPPAGDSPWLAIDFRTNPRDYLYTVLAYILDGNLDVEWRIQDNRKRKWYHAPWMEWDTYGREYVHGLTRERTGNLAEPTGLGDPGAGKRAQTWAVGFYNPLGGYTIGQVWKDPNHPNPRASQFPEGTVAAKLLFTEFTATDLPAMSGSLEWQAAIHKDPTCQRRPPQADGSEPTKCERDYPKSLRLAQLDVAVKDSRAGKTQWVFGTFAFNGKVSTDQSPLLPAGTLWNKLVPVGLMWGNDPTIPPQAFGTLQETRDLPTGLYQHLGCGGRLNGPIDNPVSSCLSCHMTAQFPVRSPTPKSIIPKACDRQQANMEYFRNLSPADLFDTTVSNASALDFSLQTQYGLINFYASNPSLPAAELSAIGIEGIQNSFSVLRR